MLFQLKFLFFIYLFFLAVWLVLFLVAVYHILKFGFKNFITMFVAFIFIAIAVLMLFFSFLYINNINWEEEINLIEEINFTDFL